ncbi:MAG: hypothetical protein HOC74_37505 [Gemmatimonadetes bacterium]|jgi:hypothetical protein|nr:hypothetical protein [Gemmatimonadota bacterium]
MKNLLTATLISILLVSGSRAQEEDPFQLIYTSSNLEGHAVAAECNPGGGSACGCTAEDVAIEFFDGYGEVTSNPRAQNTWVNAIGHKKFIETFPDEGLVALGVYQYSGQFRLTALPFPNPAQQQNGQAVHMMIQFWDGRDQLLETNKTAIEGAIYWELNPWNPESGRFKVYANPVVQVDTGIELAPDTEWHSFELVVDLKKQEYVSMAIDGEVADLEGIELARVHHPEWGDEVALVITTESMATWPQSDCRVVFIWTTQFSDLEFGRLAE